jgi:guanine deaminase
MMQTIFGPSLNPRADGSVDFIPDGALACDDNGIITHVGPRGTLPQTPAASRNSSGTILPPFLDAHIHIPQHPIRGHFMDGIGTDPPEGRLIAGLNRNVFPAEGKCADASFSEQVVDEFARETLARGVVGGAAYMTSHYEATRIALARLSPFWSLGLVLMGTRCPDYLQVQPMQACEQMRALADEFGRRVIVTDRFAVVVGSDLRRLASQIAGEYGLRTQTHLNEQLREKQLVERLYPSHASYTHVYFDDGLLDHRAILAHCIHMRREEWDVVQQTRSLVAHCPTSNTLLASGIMPLDEVKSRGIEYAICTDVGASPTTSILAEMAQFLKVHAGRSKHATPQEALYRATLAPAKMLALDGQLGSFAKGKPMSFIEVEVAQNNFRDADDAIVRGLLDYQFDQSLLPALDKLQAGQLDAGPELQSLERDARATAQRMEQKRIHVTIAGQRIV